MQRRRSADTPADFAVERAPRLEAGQEDRREQKREKEVDGAIGHQGGRHRTGRGLVADGIEDCDLEDPEPTRDVAQHAKCECRGIDRREGEKAGAGIRKQQPQRSRGGEDVERRQADLGQNQGCARRDEFDRATTQRRSAHRAQSQENDRRYEHARGDSAQRLGRSAEQRAHLVRAQSKTECRDRRKSDAESHGDEEDDAGDLTG